MLAAPIPRSSSKLRSASKLKALPLPERMLLQLPRVGLATDGQLEHIGSLYPAGGEKAIQALLNLMQSGVVDCVIWNRESWVGDSVGSVTGHDGDKLDLMAPVAMPPTGGCNLLVTEGVLESMLNQLHSSVKTINDKMTGSTQSMEEMTKDAAAVPRQVCMLVQRVRFTADVSKAILESRQLSTITRANLAIKAALGERLINKDITPGERSTMMALQQVLHEQIEVMKILIEKEKSPDECQKCWQEQIRFYHDEETKEVLLKFGAGTEERVIVICHEYSPPTMLITTQFTHMLRWSYLNAMGEGGARLLVLIGVPGCGKTGMLKNVGQLVGTQPTTVRISEQTTADEVWWTRQIVAHQSTGGGSFAPLILCQAHRAPEAVLEVALRIASECGVATCLTMSPCTETAALQKGILAGATVINVPESQLKVIAAGQLAAEGLVDSEKLAVPLGGILESLNTECTKQPHYDFGPRTLLQICTQIGIERSKGKADEDVVSAVVERCLLPKLVKSDVPILQRLLKQCFKVDKTLASPSASEDGRWHNVAENIRSITKIEPDCMVLPVPPSDQEAFFVEFCHMLNRQTAVLVRMPGLLSEMSPGSLLGTMPKKGEKVKDGLLVEMLRKAMDDHPEQDKLVWFAIMTGPHPSAEIWECLNELLNDNHCLNLATGEQLRLAENLRFLFVMEDAGNTSQDTFSRAAVVYTDPLPPDPLACFDA